MNGTGAAMEAALAGAIRHEAIAPDGVRGTVATKDLEGLPSDYKLTGRLLMYAPDGQKKFAKKGQIAKLFEAGYRFQPEQPTRTELLAENRELRKRLDDIEKIFREARRPVKSDGELATALDVAGLISEVAAREQPMSRLLGIVLGARPENFGMLLSEVAAYLAGCLPGFLEAGPHDPLRGELNSLTVRIAQKAEARARFANAIRARMEALAAQIGVTDAEEVSLYETAVVLDALSHSPEALRAAESGNWSALDQMFRQHAQRSHGQQAN